MQGQITENAQRILSYRFDSRRAVSDPGKLPRIEPLRASQGGNEARRRIVGPDGCGVDGHGYPSGRGLRRLAGVQPTASRFETLPGWIRPAIADTRLRARYCGT
jgi:hypothetical protein